VLAVGAVTLVPADLFFLQAMVFGLVAAAIISASVAYAVSLPAFLSFALPCLGPAMGYLLLSPHSLLQGWGLLAGILLAGLMVVAWQVNRLVLRNLLRRFQNLALIQHLEEAKARAEGLGMTCDVGFAERTERLIIVLVSAGFGHLFGVPYLTAAGLWLLAAASAFTVVQRLMHVRRQAVPE